LENEKKQEVDFIIKYDDGKSEAVEVKFQEKAFNEKNIVFLINHTPK